MVNIKNLFNKLRGKESEALSPLSLSEEKEPQVIDTPSSPSKEGDMDMYNDTRATGPVIARGQITLTDLTDIISQPTPPSPAKENMLWMDTSKTPPVLMVYKGGKWVKENDFKDDPEYTVITETIKKNTSEIEINKEQIALKVGQTEVTNTVITEVNKTVKSVVSEYAKNQSATTAPTSGWSTTPPSWQNGWYIWSRTTTTMMSGTSSTTTPVNITGATGATGSTGATGQGVQSITSLYKMLDTKAQQPTPTSDTGWSTTPPTWQTGKYIHTCSKIIYKNPTATAYTVPMCDSSWEAVNGVVVGGTNLLLDSSFEIGDESWTLAAQAERVQEGVDGNWCIRTTGKLATSYTKTQRLSINNLERNTEYTLTLWTKSSNVVFGTTNPIVRMLGSFYGSSSWKSELNLSPSLEGTRDWTKYSTTFKTRAESDWDRMDVSLYARDFTGIVWWDKVKLEKGNKATDWSPAPEDVENKFTKVNDKFAEIDTSLDGINLEIGEITTANYVENVENKVRSFKMGVGTNQTNSSINEKVQDSFGKISLKGKTLVNVNTSRNYTFSADVANDGKYTKTESTNRVVVDITSDLTSWRYISAGAVAKELMKPNTKYTVFFETAVGLTDVILQTGDATIQYSNSAKIDIALNRAIITTSASFTATTAPILVYCSMTGSAGNKLMAANCVVVEGEHDDLQYFEGMLSVGEEKEDGLTIKSYKGSPNLIGNSDFSNISRNNAIGWDNALNGTYTASGWTFYNGGVSGATTGYHAHLYDFEGEVVVRYMEQSNRWKSATTSLSTDKKNTLRRGRKYTISMELYTTVVGSRIFGGLYYTKQSNSGAASPGFHSGQYNFITTKANQWEKFSYTFTLGTDFDVSKTVSLYNYGDSSKGTTYMRHFKLEEGDVATPWTKSHNETSDAEVSLKDSISFGVAPYLSKIGNIYDTIEESSIGSYEFKRRCRTITLKGEAGEEWVRENSADYNRFTIELTDSLYTTSRHEILSNKFIFRDSGHAEYTCFLYYNKLYLYTSHTSADLLKEWLKTANVKICYPLNIVDTSESNPLYLKGYPQGAVLMDSIVSPTSSHTLPLNSLANIESAVATIEMTKNQISQKVNVNDVIAAINIGVENEESNILIMADKIKLTGSVTIEALDKGLQDMYIEDAGKTVIDGGFISAKTLHLSESMQANGVIVKDKTGNTTFSIEGDTGLVNIKGNVQSIDYTDPVYDANGNMTTVGTGWLIDSNGTAIFNEGEFRSKIILPRAGMSNEGNVRIWAGSKIASQAPFRVMDNGDIYVEKGYFQGVFSGDVKVGGITISDNPVPGVSGRSRAMIEVRDDTEKVVSTFADDATFIGTTLEVLNTLDVDSTGVMVSNTLKVGSSDIKLNSSDASISFKNDVAKFNLNDKTFNFTINDGTQTTDFLFSNPQRDTLVEINGQLKVSSNVDIGIVTIRKQTNGIDFLFI